MEGITKARLLSLLGGESLDRLQVEVVIQVQIVEVLAVDEEVQHVVTLTTHLQPRLYPVQLCGLKELGRLERAEQVPAQSQRSHDHKHLIQYRSVLARAY